MFILARAGFQHFSWRFSLRFFFIFNVQCRYPRWGAVLQAVNGCAAQHSGQVLMFEGKSGSGFFRSFTNTLTLFLWNHC
jgi:hypothetical protein